MGSHALRPSADEAGQLPAIAASLDAFRRIVRALRVSSRALEKDLGVSGAQLFVLQRLADGPAASIGELAARTVTDQSSVSVVISRLAQKRLVSRTPSRADARRVEIALTAKGRALLKRAPRPAQMRLIDGLERLGPPDLAGLARGLERLVVAMDIAGDRPGMFFEEDGESPEPVK
jgi:DNA-binding MarR family transcriptional regulator